MLLERPRHFPHVLLTSLEAEPHPVGVGGYRSKSFVSRSRNDCSGIVAFMIDGGGGGICTDGATTAAPTSRSRLFEQLAKAIVLSASSVKGSSRGDMIGLHFGGQRGKFALFGEGLCGFFGQKARGVGLQVGDGFLPDDGLCIAAVATAF